MKVICSSEESLYRPEAVRWRERMEMMKPVGDSVVLLPCSMKKPYSDSKSHISPDGSLLVTEYSYERSILDEVGMAVIDLHDASVRTSWHFRETPEEGESLYIPDTAVFTDDDAFVYAVTLSSSDSAFSLKSFNTFCLLS